MYEERQISPAVQRNLELLDPNLRARWNLITERWEVWRLDKPVLIIQTVDGQYHPFDNRVLQKLYICDTAKYATKWSFIEALHLADDKLAKKKIKEQDEYIRACHRDMKPFLIGRKSISFSQKTVEEKPSASQT